MDSPSLSATVQLLENSHEDILGIAKRGLGISKNEMAQRLDVEKPEIESVLNGELDGEQLIHMASKTGPLPLYYFEF